MLTLYQIDNHLFVCIWLLDAFCAMMLVTDDADAYSVPRLTGVGMDVIVRQSEEFQTSMPGNPVEA